jgi:hypothetical protein
MVKVLAVTNEVRAEAAVNRHGTLTLRGQSSVPIDMQEAHCNGYLRLTL